MFRGKDFDPFSSTQPVDDWFKAPFGIEETVKALETWKKSTSKVLFGEVPAERKGERWTKVQGIPPYRKSPAPFWGPIFIIKDV